MYAENHVFDKVNTFMLASRTVESKCSTAECRKPKAESSGLEYFDDFFFDTE